MNFFKHVSLRDADQFEERIFSSLNVSPKLKTYVVRKNLFPGFDLMAGFDITMNLPTNYTSATTPIIEDAWQQDSASDIVHVPLSGVWSFLIGINATY